MILKKINFFLLPLRNEYKKFQNVKSYKNQIKYSRQRYLFF